MPRSDTWFQPDREGKPRHSKVTVRFMDEGVAALKAEALKRNMAFSTFMRLVIALGVKALRKKDVTLPPPPSED